MSVPPLKTLPGRNRHGCQCQIQDFPRTISAVCPQSNLLATILSEEPLITKCITLHTWTNKDSSFLAGSTQSVLSNDQYTVSNNFPGLCSPVHYKLGCETGRIEWTYLHTGISRWVCSTSSISASAGTIIASARLGDTNGRLIALLRIIIWSRKGFALETGIWCTLLERSGKGK